MVRILLTEIKFKPERSMMLDCDNQAARKIANKLVQHDRTKHVEADRNFIKEKLDVKFVDFSFVKTEEQLADILTHAVLLEGFVFFFIIWGYEISTHQLGAMLT